MLGFYLRKYALSACTQRAFAYSIRSFHLLAACHFRSPLAISPHTRVGLRPPLSLRSQVVSVAAVKFSDRRVGRLDPRNAVRMLRKAQTILRTALKHGADALVLSAFGCGAYNNPPMDVAEIMREAIRGYGGRFKKIVFAIFGGGGNFETFRAVFRHAAARDLGPPSRLVSAPPTQPPCDDGGVCSQIDRPDHMARFEHPPWCPRVERNEACPLAGDEVHQASFIHQRPCPYVGQCHSRHRPDHDRYFAHPEQCPEGRNCVNVDSAHLNRFAHFVECKHGRECRDIDDANHNYRHIAAVCKHDTFCRHRLDPEHRRVYRHRFNEVCPSSGMTVTGVVGRVGYMGCSSWLVEGHRDGAAHVCADGLQCKHLRDANHTSQTVHVAKARCRYDRQCTDVDEYHLTTFAHHDVADVRRPCKYGAACRNQGNPDFARDQTNGGVSPAEATHRRQFLHPQHVNSPCGILRCHTLGSHNNRGGDGVDFGDNARSLVGIPDSTGRARGRKAPREIERWVRDLTALHRCAPNVLTSILNLGQFVARTRMLKFAGLKTAQEAVETHPKIRAAATSDAELRTVIELGNKCAELVYAERDERLLATIPDLEADIQGLRGLCEEMVGRVKTEEVEQRSQAVAEAGLALYNLPVGIGYEVDELIGTDNQVFSIVNKNHDGTHYGECLIVLDQDILRHPDSSITASAGTSYVSCGNWGRWKRPWMPAHDARSDEAKTLFHREKVNAGESKTAWYVWVWGYRLCVCVVCGVCILHFNS